MWPCMIESVYSHRLMAVIRSRAPIEVIVMRRRFLLSVVFGFDIFCGTVCFVCLFV